MIGGLGLAAALAIADPAAAQAPSGAIRDAVLAEMSRLGIPGLTLAVAEGTSLIHEAAFGFADVENGVRARSETVYRLASVSKPMTAVAVLRLTERGLLDLDAPVWQYCPDFPEKPWHVTARQLLCHQGGIRHYRPDEPTLTQRFDSFAAALALFRDDPLLHEPGTGVRYSTYGYNLLGCAGAGAARTAFLTLLREAVFRPAGMTATGADDVREITPHRAQGYVRDENGRLRNSALADMSYKLPGGGLSGTAADVARFGSALISGRLVSPATLEQMLTRQKTRDGRVTGYGLGLTPGEREGRPEAWHTGGQERVSSVLYLSLDRGVTGGGRAVAILTNLERVQPEMLVLARRVSGALAPGRRSYRRSMRRCGRRAVISDSSPGSVNPLACRRWLRGCHVDVPNVAVAPRIFDEMDTLAPEHWSGVVTESRVSAVFGRYCTRSRNKFTWAHVLQIEREGGVEEVMSGRRASTYIGVAMVGGVVGAIVGLLVAPGPGDETRRRIARHSIEDQERLLRLAEMGSDSDLLGDDSDLPASA